MSGKRLIAARHLVGSIGAALKRLGFREVSKSPNGSRYYIWPPLSHRLRLSDHDLPPFHQWRNPSTFLVTLTPMTDDEIADAALAIAIGFVLHVRLRMLR